MPRYDYTCSPCEATFEVSRPMAESDAPAFCPRCDQPAQRAITLPRFMFMKPSAIDERAEASAINAARWNHSGHSHGPGAAAHTH